MNKKELKELIKESLREARTERADKISKTEKVLKESLKKMVKNVLSEIMSVPHEPTKEEKEVVDKQYNKKGNEKLEKTRIELGKELAKIVHDINKDFRVYWDDHNDLNIDAKALFRIRISQKAENNFDVEAMINLDDRIKAVALTWEQVKAMVKENFKDVEDIKVNQAKKKAMDHLEDKTDKGDLPQHDKPKKKEVGDTKNDEKDYNEKDVKKDEDLQDQPAKEVDVDKLKYQRDFTDKENKVKPPKHKTDKKLVAKDKKTPKLK